MYKVIYSYYGKFAKEKSFDNYVDAKYYFNRVRRINGVTKAELIV